MKIIYCVQKPLEILLSKSQTCDMTLMSGAFYKSAFDGNTISLKISEENEKNRYSYIGGDMICYFVTNDKFYKCTSNMEINLTPYSIAVGHEDV